ncbi:TPA: hypothetical protein JBD69_11280 [Legionella pneumophila subsp. pneumophila]|nr:hypothetical protein [Legionella pneumophila subsp. pneumophila]
MRYVKSLKLMCYKTTIDNKKAYLYFLLEHQSKPDPLMPFRLLKYPVMYTPVASLK